MQFKISKNNQNCLARLRRLGYAILQTRQGKVSFVKRTHGADYPRFHLYVNREDDNYFYCSLHLDQSRQTYIKGQAHKGDYDSPLIKAEAERLWQ